MAGPTAGLSFLEGAARVTDDPPRWGAKGKSSLFAEAFFFAPPATQVSNRGTFRRRMIGGSH